MINYNFLKDNKSKLIDIYIKERYVENNNKEGCLVINFSLKDKIDVYYLSIDNMPERIKNRYIEDYYKESKNEIFIHDKYKNSDNKMRKKVLLMIVDNDILETIIHYLD